MTVTPSDLESWAHGSTRSPSPGQIAEMAKRLIVAETHITWLRRQLRDPSQEPCTGPYIVPKE